MKWVHKLLSLFDMCDHDFSYRDTQMREHKTKNLLVTRDTYVCSKCGQESHKYYYQDKSNL